ncbi:hypothetical protein BH09PLA1_BH09PLA1_21930 [soil metagenome]
MMIESGRTKPNERRLATEGPRQGGTEEVEKRHWRNFSVSLCLGGKTRILLGSDAQNDGLAGAGGGRKEASGVLRGCWPVVKGGRGKR